MSEPAPIDPSAWPVPTDAVVAEWLGKALKDTERMERQTAHGFGSDPDDICFHAQQAVEKAMKAALIARGATPPYTHDLIALSRSLESLDASWSWPRDELRLLTLGAVHFRYPGLSATEDVARDAVCTARRVLAAIKRFF